VNGIGESPRRPLVRLKPEHHTHWERSLAADRPYTSEQADYWEVETGEVAHCKTSDTRQHCQLACRGCGLA
jgi:hypothetical protein